MTAATLRRAWARLGDRLHRPVGELPPTVALCLVATLGFEALPLPVKAQVLPLTGALAVFVLPFLWRSLRRYGWSTPVARAVALFAGYAVAHSLVALAIEAASSHATPIRLEAWLRQLASLAIGLAVFTVLRSTLPAVAGGRLAIWVALSGVPGVLLAAVNMLWASGRHPLAELVVSEARAYVVPQGYSFDDRASGFCFEPAHFAFFLAVIVVPAVVALVLAGRGPRLVTVPALALALLAVVSTFSFHGLMILLAVLAAIALNHRWRRTALLTLAALLTCLAVIWIAFPGNYVRKIVTRLAAQVATGDIGKIEPTAGVVLFGSIGPYLRVFSSLNLLGYGLGGTATHIDEIIPAAGRRFIDAASWRGMPNLTTSLGRVFAETGLLGLLLFARIFLVAGRRLSQSHGRESGDGRMADALRTCAAAALAGLAVGHALKFGSYAIPFLWFWLAYIDSRDAMPLQRKFPATPRPVEGQESPPPPPSKPTRPSPNRLSDFMPPGGPMAHGQLIGRPTGASPPA